MTATCSEQDRREKRPLLGSEGQSRCGISYRAERDSRDEGGRRARRALPRAERGAPRASTGSSTLAISTVHETCRAKGTSRISCPVTSEQYVPFALQLSYTCSVGSRAWPHTGAQMSRTPGSARFKSRHEISFGRRGLRYSCAPPSPAGGAAHSRHPTSPPAASGAQNASCQSLSGLRRRGETAFKVTAQSPRHKARLARRERGAPPSRAPAW